MLKSLALGLVMFALVLLSRFALAPANASTSGYENYIWTYESIGSNQLVCKKIVMHSGEQLTRPSSNEKVVQMGSTATIVSDRYCANSAKPYLASSK